MVKCSDCGFLLDRQRRDTREALSGGISSVPPAHREDGLPVDPKENLYEWQINVERLCPTSADGKHLGFTKWQQGFTPKEHREMLDRQWMLDREERRDKEMREWQEAQGKKAQEFQWKATMRGAVIGAIVVGIFSLFAPWYQTTVTKPPVVNNIIQIPASTPTPIPTFTPTPTIPPTPASQ